MIKFNKLLITKVFGKKKTMVTEHTSHEFEPYFHSFITFCLKLKCQLSELIV